MNRYHPVIAIILGNFVIGFLVFFVKFLPRSLFLDLLTISVFILGGFAAVYLSRTNNARIGFYNNFLYSIGALLGLIFIFKRQLSIDSLLALFLLFPIVGLFWWVLGERVKVTFR